MSADSDNKSPLAVLDLDLHFLPAWAQQPADANRYAKYTGNEESGRGERRGGRGFGGSDRGPRRDGGGGRGPRPQGQGGQGGFRPEGQRGPRPGGGQGGDRRGGGGFRGRDDRRGGFRGRQEERRELPPLPPIDVNFIPEEKGVESLARQIKLTGRAYPLFEIAGLILKKPERYHVQLVSQKKEGKRSRRSIFVSSMTASGFPKPTRCTTSSTNISTLFTRRKKFRPIRRKGLIRLWRRIR